jgi:hypothetical protein
MALQLSRIEWRPAVLVNTKDGETDAKEATVASTRRRTWRPMMVASSAGVESNSGKVARESP